MKNKKTKLTAIKLDEIRKATPTLPEEPKEFDIFILYGEAKRLEKMKKDLQNRIVE